MEENLAVVLDGRMGICGCTCGASFTVYLYETRLLSLMEGIYFVYIADYTYIVLKSV